MNRIQISISSFNCSNCHRSYKITVRVLEWWHLFACFLFCWRTNVVQSLFARRSLQAQCEVKPVSSFILTCILALEVNWWQELYFFLKLTHNLERLINSWCISLSMLIVCILYAWLVLWLRSRLKQILFPHPLPKSARWAMNYPPWSLKKKKSVLATLHST